MFKIIVLLMVVIPALEIWGLLTIGSWIGGWQTFSLILLTGFVGAFLAKRESKKVWEFARNQMSSGQIPGGAILDGLCIFAGGLLLLTPGFFTDTIGFLLVLPFTRPVFKAWMLVFIQKKMRDGSIQFFRRW
jgi:UPF0716 protein FxsA